MKRILGIVFMFLGTICIVSAVGIVYHNYQENAAAGDASDALLAGVLAQIPETVLAADENGNMPVVDVDGRSFIGTVSVP